MARRHTGLPDERDGGACVQPRPAGTTPDPIRRRPALCALAAPGQPPRRLGTLVRRDGCARRRGPRHAGRSVRDGRASRHRRTRLRPAAPVPDRRRTRARRSGHARGRPPGKRELLPCMACAP